MRIAELESREDTTSEEYQKRQIIRQASLLLASEKLKLLEEILARSRNLDEGVTQFRKLMIEPAVNIPHEESLRKLGEQPNVNEVHKIVESEEEMLRLLNEGWELVRELNGDRFLMKRT